MYSIVKFLYFLTVFTFVPKTQAAVYLSWQNDPSKSMVIHWYEERQDDPQIGYRKKGENVWSYKEGTYVCLQYLPIRVNSVELFDLEPNTEYEFILPNQKIYRFRSLAIDLTRPLCFAVGGDAYYYLGLMRKMALQIAARAPDFVVVGGDIAYTCGRLFKQRDWKEKRWIAFFNTWSETMKTPEGRLIPIVGVLGNHDIEPVGLEEDELLYKFLPEIKFFKVMDVNNILSLFLLDTEHRYRVKAQEKWLESELKKREKSAYKMAVYHVSGYPSVYSAEGEIPKRVRKYWHPHFDRYRLQIAFENHNHAYKRTYPLKNGTYDPDGVIYMGDGSWGVWPRAPKERWYLEKAAKVNAVCLIQIDQEKARVDALDIKGRVIDSVIIMPQGAAFAP